MGGLAREHQPRPIYAANYREAEISGHGIAGAHRTSDLVDRLATRQTAKSRGNSTADVLRTASDARDNIGRATRADGTSNKIRRAYEFLVLTVTCVSLASGHASAAEIKSLFPLAFKSSFNELLPRFEESTGNKVAVDYGTIGALTARVEKGEVADIVIVSDKQFNELRQQGKVVADTRVDVAKLGVGAFVGKGAPKQDISSVEAFKRALMDAKAIAYLDPTSGAPSGIYMATLIERLGIAAQMTPKTRLLTGKSLFDAVVNGDADIGFIQITELLAEPRVELLGPLPLAIQDYTNYSAGVLTASQHRALGAELISFITTPSAKVVMKARGFEDR
jgi:molybdate transport system substrate-binding protein